MKYLEEYESNALDVESEQSQRWVMKSAMPILLLQKNGIMESLHKRR